MARLVVHRLVFAVVFSAASLGCFHRSAKGDIVYDPWNFQQNYLAAFRALQQVNAQLRQIQTEVAMLETLQKNIASTGQSVAPDIRTNLDRFTALTETGNGIALKVQETETGFQKLFPSQTQTLSASDALVAAKNRWQETLGDFQRASVLDAATIEGLPADTAMLNGLLTRSRNAGGALEAAQAGNELAGLQIKQSLALQALLDAHGRAETFDRARTLSAQGDAQARLKTFLGDGSAYGAGR